MFAQMPLFVYRHFKRSVCTMSSDGVFVGMIAFTEFPQSQRGIAYLFLAIQCRSDRSLRTVDDKDITLLFLLSYPSSP
jgi:hypothetical protein